MIKLIYCLRRLPHLSLAEFQRYWRENHGPLVRSVQKAIRVKRYVQCHTIYDEKLGETPTTPGRPQPYDGVAMLWYSLEDRASTIPDPERREAGAILTEDEKKFIDFSRSPVWLSEEHVFVDEMPLAPAAGDKPDSAVKQIYCGHFLPSLTKEEAKQYWREKHGPLVQSVAETLHVRRYVQCHLIENEGMEQRRREGGRPEPYPGVAELWYDSLEDLTSPTPERQQAAQTLFEDEKNFVDFSRSPLWLAREIVFIDER